MVSVLLKKALPHLAALLVFIVLSCMYFAPQIEGKKLISTDISSYTAVSHEMKLHEEETGHYPLWTNSIFSGMPGYQIGIPSQGSPAGFIEKLTQLFIGRPIGYFIGGCICFYILMIAMGVSPWLAVIGAVTFSFTTNNIVLFEAGHMSKIRTLFQCAPAIAGLLLIFRKKYIAGSVLYGLGMAVAIYGGHYQMIYYVFLGIGLYLLFELFQAFREGELPAFGKALGIMVLLTIVAVGTSAPRLLSTYEYAKDTMRGDPILENNDMSSQSSSETEGLDWEYAMRWSNGLKDVAAAIVPRAAGGGSQESSGESSNVRADFRQRGIQIPPDLKLPLYHGSLPFTSGPVYFGAILVFLCILGGFILKGKLKWWLVLTILLTFILSMGSHFPVINRLLFDYFPMYNKFRAPSSVLTVTALFIPMLALLGLRDIHREKLKQADTLKALYWSVGIAGGLCLILAILGPSMFSFNSANDNSYQQAGFNMDALFADRKMYLRLDAFRSLGFILAAAGALWLYIKGRMGLAVMAAALFLLSVIDLWGVNSRYISSEQYVTEKQNDNYFQLTDIDRRILQDPDIHYRVHDLSRDPWNDAYRAYWHKLVGGYHAAKLQRYQDMIDFYLAQGNQQVFNMLNTRYFIFQDDSDKLNIQRNSEALGNAWFVNNVVNVASADEEIRAIGNINPARTAVLHNDFQAMGQGIDTTGSGTIKLTSYAPDKLVYTSQTTGEKLAVFSEVWYGPDKGWKVTIDGEKAEMGRANYILRALRVPAGNHEIIFEFHPSSYHSGVAIAYTSSGLLLVLLGYAMFVAYKNREEWMKEEEPRQAKPKSPQKKTRKNRR